MVFLKLYYPICVQFFSWNQGYACLKIMTSLQVIVSVVAVFNFASWLVNRGYTTSSFWAKGSFFVCVTHTLLLFIRWTPLTLSNKVLQSILPSVHPLVYLLQFLLAPILTLAICLGIYSLLKRFLPRTIALLDGNR